MNPAECHHHAVGLMTSTQENAVTAEVAALDNAPS